MLVASEKSVHLLGGLQSSLKNEMKAIGAATSRPRLGREKALRDLAGL
jgi:hypothetical protein